MIAFGTMSIIVLRMMLKYELINSSACRLAVIHAIPTVVLTNHFDFLCFLLRQRS